MLPCSRVENSKQLFRNLFLENLERLTVGKYFLNFDFWYLNWSWLFIYFSICKLLYFIFIQYMQRRTIVHFIHSSPKFSRWQTSELSKFDSQINSMDNCIMWYHTHIFSFISVSIGFKETNKTQCELELCMKVVYVCLCVCEDLSNVNARL